MKRKEHILVTALALFNEGGTQASTTNHIAKAMEISPGNLHYHYNNREEIVKKLYLQMREKITLNIEFLPKTINELMVHEKLLITIQWEYRFFFKEMITLFTKDESLEKQYVTDNIAHRSRIKMVMEHLIKSGELQEVSAPVKEYLVDSILMSWQFYSAYLQTLGRDLNVQTAHEVIDYTNQAIAPYLTPQALERRLKEQ